MYAKGKMKFCRNFYLLAAGVSGYLTYKLLKENHSFLALIPFATSVNSLANALEYHEKKKGVESDEKRIENLTGKKIVIK